jgi:hypothetical protein
VTKAARVAWFYVRFWSETAVLYHHWVRPRPKGVRHKMRLEMGQSASCACGRTFR